MKESLLCKFAQQLTIKSESFKKDEIISELKIFEISDNAILGATLEDDEGTGYNY